METRRRRHRGDIQVAVRRPATPTLVHGGDIDDSDLPVGVRWGVGGAISLKFAQEGFFTVLTTRNQANAAPLEAAIREAGDDAMIVELDLASRDSISNAFARIREEAGDPDVLVYNAGYLEGRDLPPEMELMENIPFEMYENRPAHRQQRPLPGHQGGAALQCGRRARAPSSFPTTTSPCGAASGTPGSRCTIRGC